MIGLSPGGRARRYATAGFSLIALLLMCAQTQAQYAYAFDDLDQIRVSEPGPGDWSVTIGAGAAQAADYSGASTYGTMFLPVVEASWQNRLHISTLQGIRFDLAAGSSWEAGPLVRLMAGRPDEGVLSEIDEVDGGLAGGMYLGYRLGAVHFRADAAGAMTGDVSGAELIVGATWRGRLAPRWLATLGPSVIWKSGSRMRDLYEVTPTDAQTLGVPDFRPSSGVSAVRLSGSLTYILDQHWSASLIGVGAVLTGDAADSPVADELGDERYGKLGLTVAYRF